MDAQTRTQTPVLRCEGLTRRFARTVALNDVDFVLNRASVHGLVGPNGAGKSTLMGILSGRIPPSSGKVEVADYGHLPFGSPAASRAAGIAIVYQELAILSHRSVADNVFLGQMHQRCGVVRRKSMVRRLKELGEIVGTHLRPDTICGGLSVADQQAVEIMRALNLQPNILILDEPTAPLAEVQRNRLLDTVRRIKAGGTTVVFISHNLDEVLEICDEVSVLRNGNLVESKPTRDWDKASLVETMLTRQLIQIEHSRAASTATAERVAHRKPVLTVRGMDVRPKLSGVSLTLHAGEILGIGGLVGSGRTTLLRALAGHLPSSAISGEIMFADGPSHALRNPRMAIKEGIAMVPEDRKAAGVILRMNCADNVTMASWRSVSRFGFLSARRQMRVARTEAETVGFQQFDRLDLPIEQLSGGNQQKLIIAKWLWQHPTVLLCDEPTRGIDVGAKAEILMLIKNLASQGLGVLFVSSDLEEVVAVSHRVLVLREGQVVGELAGEAVSEDNILALAFRQNEEVSA